MYAFPFLQSLTTLLVAGKFLAAIKFLLYRLASWFGIGFFWKKGKDSGQKRFYWIAFLIWLTSWGMILYFSPHIWRYCATLFQS